MVEIKSLIPYADDAAALAVKTFGKTPVAKSPSHAVKNPNHSEKSVADLGGVAPSYPGISSDEALQELLGRGPKAKPRVPVETPHVPTAVDAVVGAAEKVESATGTFLGVDFALFAAGGLAGVLGFKNAKEKLNKPKHFLESKTIAGKVTAYNALLDGSFVLGSALGAYGVVRSFNEKMESLKLMYADMTGKDVSEVSTNQVLTGEVPKAVADARDHLKKEHGTRFAAQLTGLGLNLRGLLKGGGGMASMLGFMLPQAASMVVDAVMGESPVLHVYKGISNAYKNGEAIPVETYAEFVCAASPEFAKMGAENAITRGVAEQLAAQKVSPAKILEMAENGKLIKMGDHAAQGAVAPAEEHKEFSQVDALTKGRHFDRAVVGDGKHTGSLAAKDMHIDLLAQRSAPGMS